MDLAQVFKQLRRQSHRSGRHADAVGANFGRTAHLFGHRERALEHLVQGGTQSAHLASHTHRVFHLSQDLRLAKYHGVQTAGDAKRMTCGLVVHHGVNVVVQAVGAHATRLGQPLQRLGHGDFLRCAINFGAVASGEDGGLGLRAKTLTQTVEHRPDLLNGKCEPAPQIERSGGVVES